MKRETYNIEDTAELLTESYGKKRTVKVVLIVIALVAVLITAIVGIKMLGDKRYNKQIAIADKAFDEGDYEKAEVGYLDAVKLNKRKIKGREGIAYTYAVLEKYDDSSSEYRSLYDDTKKKKYKVAADETAEGKLPSDESLIPRNKKNKQAGNDATSENTEKTPEEAPMDDGQVLVDEYKMGAVNASVNNSGVDIPKVDFLYDFLLRYEQYNCGEFDAVAPVSNDNYVMLRLCADEMINTKAYNVGEYIQRIDGSDPRGLNSTSKESITDNAYCRADKAKLDWLASNVFNMSDENIVSAVKNQEEKDLMYGEGDYYYCVPYRTGLGPAPSIGITKCKKDGNVYELNFNVDWSYMGNAGQQSTRYSKMEIKKIDGVWYWTIHEYYEYVSPELGTAL